MSYIAERQIRICHTPTYSQSISSTAWAISGITPISVRQAKKDQAVLLTSHCPKIAKHQHFQLQTEPWKTTLLGDSMCSLHSSTHWWRRSPFSQAALRAVPTQSRVRHTQGTGAGTDAATKWTHWNRVPFQGQGTYLCTSKETAYAENRSDFVNHKYPTFSTVEV